MQNSNFPPMLNGRCYTVPLQASELWKAQTGPSPLVLILCCDQEGTSPDPRGNHTASLIDATLLLVLGGRDTGRYFDDTHVLDTATLTWTHVRNLKNPSAPCRICSHVAEGLHSVPSYKLFCFGGQTGSDKSRCEWSYRDKVPPPATIPVKFGTRGLLIVSSIDTQHKRTPRALRVVLPGQGASLAPIMVIWRALSLC